MRYTKEHKNETHRRIVEKASQRFRDEGLDAVGVASLMGSVGLTVGGFYAHFSSKDALIAEAAQEGFAATTERFRQYLLGFPAGERMQALVDAYLSPSHRDKPGTGCVAAANAAELARLSPEVRQGFTKQQIAWVKLVEEAMEDDMLTGDALGIVSTLVGTMVLARAVDDRLLSEAFLASGRQAILKSLLHSQPAVPSLQKRRGA